MRNRKIKFVRGENIICFKKIEINFEKLGSVIVVRGKNFDDQEIGVNSNFNSNGSGKSSLADVISYALYGKTLKKPKKIAHGDVIHNDADYLKVEIAIDNYLITRTRKRTKSSDKGTLDVWRDGSKLSMSKPILEKLVIEEVIGLTYEVFSNVFLFGDDISSSFLECDLTDKRNIVENLLSLDRFRDYHENAKNNLKNIKDTIKEASRSVEVASSDLSKIEFRYKDLKSKSFLWTEKQSREISDLKKEIQNIKSIDTSNELIKYSESKLLLSKIENDYKSLSLKREQATTYQSAAETKFSVAQKMCADYNNKLTKISSEIKSLEINLNLINKFLNSLPDGCPTCGQDLPDPDRDRLNVEKINEKNICENKLKELIVEKNKLSEELKVFNESKKTLSDVIFECRKKIGVFDSEMFKLRSEITKLSSVKPPKESEVILETIKGLENRITDKLSEINPYISLLKNVELEEIDKKNELEIKNKELDNAKEDLPYREFIVKLFGDDGVRKYVVDNSIPTLNSRISYWLGILCGGRLKLFFNNSFDEFVDKYPFDGKKYDYHGLSNGQRRRLVLALSQAFSYLMAVTSGSSLNIVFFDEVSLNIDAAGVEAISRMIGEVAKDRQVILVDHNQDLLSSFDGSDQINVLMKNGSSELVESF